jgi:hypothetical protein
MSVWSWLKQVTDRRRTPRFVPEALVAHFWTGGMPRPSSIHDIGLYGARVITKEVFYAGTLLQIVLQNLDQPDTTICVFSQVLRKTEDGFSVSFVFGQSKERRLLARFLSEVRRKPVAESQPAAPGPDGGGLLEEASSTGRPDDSDTDLKNAVGADDGVRPSHTEQMGIAGLTRAASAARHD